MVRLYAKDKERIEKLEQSEAGRKFLRRKCKTVSTTKSYVRGAFIFAEFFDKTIPQIVAEYQTDAEKNPYKAWDKWEMVFEDYADHLKAKYPKGSTAATYFAAAVGLINANVPSSAEIHPKTPKAYSRSIPPITIEDLRIVRNIADERERAFIDVLKDTGISRADAVRLTYKDVKRAIEDPNVRSHKIGMYREKEHVEYETWLGPNAIESLRIFFDIRKRLGEQITDESWVFALKGNNQPLEPPSLSAVFRRLSHRSGIEITPHKLRKFFETYITAGGAHPLVAKYWMGHTIHADVDSRYIIPPENLQRDQYMKAYNKIDLEAKVVDEREQRIQAIRDNLRMLGKSEEEIRMATMSLRRASNIEEAIKKVLRDSNEPEDPNGCPNGTHCSERFEEINESNLLSYLQNGYQIVHNLQNGRVIVKR